MAGGPPEEDEAEELLRLRLPPDAPRWQRAALAFARQRLRLPEGLLALAVHAGLRFWLGLLAWMAGARAAAAWELGPVYIIASILAVMLLNLGTRREGEWSAYRCAQRGMSGPGGDASPTRASRRCGCDGHADARAGQVGYRSFLQRCMCTVLLTTASAFCMLLAPAACLTQACGGCLDR